MMGADARRPDVRSPVALRALRRPPARRRGRRSARPRPAWSCSPCPTTTPSTASTRRWRPRERCGIRVVPATELSSIDGDLRRPAHPRLRHRPRRPGAARPARGVPRRPRGARRTGWRPRCRSSASRSTTRRSPPAGPRASRSGARTSPRPCIDHPANAQRLREEGTDDVSPFIVAYLIAGTPGFRGAHDAHGAGGDRRDPRRGRHRDLGAPVLGPRHRGGGRGRDRPLRRLRRRRGRGVLRHPHRRADAVRRRRLRGAAGC